MNRIYIYIPGILNLPANCRAWTDRAVTWTITRREIPAEKYEYFSDVLCRRFYQQDRAERLFRMIYNHYRSWDVVLVAHSNGSDVVMRMFNMIEDRMPFDEVHFLAPACSRQAKYELNSMIARKQLKKCKIYIGGADVAMKWAAVSVKLLGPFGLGYGDMGAEDPCALAHVLGAGSVIYEPEYDHSTWWQDDQHFEKTMQLITA